MYKTDTTTQTSARFVHYTTAEAAAKIITTKRLWMRNTTCMTDYREVRHGFDILSKFFLNKDKRSKFDEAFDACAPGIAQEAINSFNHWWQNLQLGTFITSISEHDERENVNGRLSMWRGFGGNAARVAMVLRVPSQTDAGNALSLMFSPVTYFTEPEAHELLWEVIENVKRESAFLKTIERSMLVANVFAVLILGVTCSKHEGFREEREWRAIYIPSMRSSPFMESSTEVIAGVPQIIHKLPLDEKLSPYLKDLELMNCFDRLIIGPSQFPLAMYEAFVAALKQSGIADAEQRVVVSNIPIRT